MRIFASCQCADYVCASYTGVVRMTRVVFAAGEAVQLFDVCSIQAIMAPPRRRPWPPATSSAINYIYMSQAYLNVSDCVTHIMAYTYGSG